MFKYYNPHPKGLDVDDCVKRSLLAVLGRDWSYHRVTLELNSYKKITGAESFNAKPNPHRYVENVLGAEKITVQQEITACVFCQKHARGRYILDMEGHWSACVDGCIYDTWDCGGEKVNFAYKICTTPYTPPDIESQVLKYCCTSKVISDTQTRIRIYDGNGVFTERIIPSELTRGYVRCLQDGNYNYVEL